MTVILSNIGCQIAIAKSAMTVGTNLPLFGDVITVVFVARYFADAVAAKKYLEI